MIFDRFSQPARRTIAKAQDEALTLGHDHIGTEHLLLGLLDVPDTGAYDVLTERGLTSDHARSETLRRMSEAGYPAQGARAPVDTLAEMGIDIDELRRRADETFGAGKFQYPRPGFTARAKRVLELTLREARARPLADHPGASAARTLGRRRGPRARRSGRPRRRPRRPAYGDPRPARLTV